MFNQFDILQLMRPDAKLKIMELKKNPKKDLNKNRGLYFVAGLALIMSLAYVALEWKTYDREICYDCISMNEPDIIEEEIPPIIEIKLPPPPKPPAIVDKIEVLKEDDKREETVIAVTELFPDEPVAVDSVIVEEVEEDIEVPFVAIEDVPIFPGCENDSDKKACFQKMITKHIRRTQRYPETAQEVGAQGRVSVVFTIAKDGSIGNVRMRGPHASLEKEASRIISKLPKMTAGKQRGKPVKVSFSQPIIFRLQ